LRALNASSAVAICIVIEPSDQSGQTRSYGRSPATEAKMNRTNY